MPYVLIRHKVANYAKWKRAVGAAAKFRKAGGEKTFKAFRSSANTNDVTVICSWATTAKMRKFMKSPDLRKAMRAAGVKGKPQIQFFSSREDLGV